MTSDARRQSARDLLEDAARQGNDLETVARGVLARLAELTGLSSTYLAETRLTMDEQYIVFSCNRSDVFHIPEDVTLPWSEGVCRFVVEGGPHYTTDAQKQFPSSSVARQVEIEQKVLDLMRECARLIGQRLRADVSARP